MDRIGDLPKGEPADSGIEGTDNEGLKVSIIGVSESWRVSQLLQASGLGDDPSQPYYPQFTMVAKVGMKNSSSVPATEDAGFISIRFVNQTVYVVSILVHPKYRKMSIAESLFAMVEDIAKVWNCQRVAFKLRAELRDLAGAVVKRGYEKFIETEGVTLYVKELGG